MFVRVEELGCGAGSVAADLTLPDELRLQLTRPLDGRRIIGPGRDVRARSYNSGDGANSPIRVPDLIGLQLGQARDVAAVFGTTIEATSLAASTAQVVGQTPAAGVAETNEPIAVTLR